MADREQDKGRDSRRKKFYHTYKDREEKHYGSRRLPIILTKTDSERDSNKDGRSGTGTGPGTKLRPQENQEKPLSQPTIILRTREGDNRALSPNQRNVRSKKEGETQPPLYHLAAKHSNTENVNPLARLPEMKASVKLLEDGLQFSDAALEFLTDQTDFLVAGVIGMQGVGKSTIMSHLAGSSLDRKKTLFKVQNFEQQEFGIHCTVGVDMVVTANRLILLDSQPILSGSVMERLLQQDQKKAAGPPMGGSSCTIEFSSSESMAEVGSLQIAAFLLSVCHIVIVVQDWFFDPNLLRFLQSAEMLKPPTPTTSQDEELVEYFPHVLFVHNQAQAADFTKERIDLMQNVYSQTFAMSRLQILTGLGITNAGILESLEFSEDSLNIFLLPDFVEEEEEENRGQFKGHPGYRELMQKLRHRLHGATPSPLTHTTLTEKNWLHYASKIWDGVKKSSFFFEYSRLMP